MDLNGARALIILYQYINHTVVYTLRCKYYMILCCEIQPHIFNLAWPTELSHSLFMCVEGNLNSSGA